MPYREPEPHEPKRATPVYLDGPLAWEDPEQSWPLRFLRTLGSAFLPLETARAVAAGALGPALRFCVLSALPWTPWWTVIPATHLIQFKSGFAYEIVQKPGLSLEEDVARAMAIGVVASLLSLVAWALPFASLLQAFSREPQNADIGRAAWRMALYRTWILPLGLTLFWVAAWGLPKDTPGMAIDMVWLCFRTMPRLLIVIHCHALARYFGAGPGAALVVSIVPVAVEGTALALAEKLAQDLLPVMPAAEG